jgi:plastocyanin
MRAFPTIAVLAAVVLAAACGGGTTAPLTGVIGPAGGGGGTGGSTGGGGGGGGGHSLIIDANPNITFTPTPDTVQRGATVQFAFASLGHNVQFTSAGSPANIGSPSTPLMNSDSTRVFPTPGTYSYHCGIHGLRMSGTIVVQ